jgi:hypothetical protein
VLKKLGKRPHPEPMTPIRRDRRRQQGLMMLTGSGEQLKRKRLMLIKPEKQLLRSSGAWPTETTQTRW